MKFAVVGPDDRAAVLEILLPAFSADPLMRWALGPDDYERRLRVLYDHLIGDGVLPFGRCRIAEDGSIAGVILGPGDHLSEQFWAERAERLAGELGGDIDRLVLMNAASEAHLPTQPHWNFMFAGVRRGDEGRGLATELIAAVLEEVDRRGEPMYGEATNPRMRAVAERMGFRVLDEYRVLDSPPIWTLWRDAASPA